MNVINRLENVQFLIVARLFAKFLKIYLHFLTYCDQYKYISILDGILLSTRKRFR